MENSFSSSSFIEEQSLTVSSHFSSFQEIPSEGFSRLVKAKRYGRWFMLKCLKTEFADQTLYRQLLKKEFEIGISLNHKNIVSVVGWELIDGYGECIIQEYIEGVGLNEFLNKRSKRVVRRKLAGELLEAVSYMNVHQIVHRDLKPTNIMVTTNGNNLKIIDFGLSDTDDYAILKEPAGSEKYMSPEQKVSSTPDCRNDVYSVGTILRIMDAGADYNAIARKCRLDISHRYRSIDDAAASILKRKRLKVAASIIVVLLFVAGVCSYALLSGNQKYNRHITEQEQHQKMLTEAINEGKRLSDTMTDEIMIYINSMVTDFSMIENGLDEYMKQMNDYTERMSIFHAQFSRIVDSLSVGFNETDKSIISNGINTHHDTNCKKLVESAQDIKMPMLQ